MANQSIVPADIAARYEVHEWRNGLAILSAAHPDEWKNIVEVLRGFTLLKSDILKPGGSKGLIASKLDSHFTELGWAEKKFETKIVVDRDEHVAPTHKVDCYKNRVALEVEWTHMAKLVPRLDGGGGGGCLVVVFGIRDTAYVED